VGVEVVAVIDSRATASARASQVAADTGVRLILGAAVTGTAGEGPAGRISGITVSALDDDAVAAPGGEDIAVDLLAV
ncbi:UNVERIFIED_CONTAM: hypothetical protein IGO34_37080, partial [Salmonella enterica subsp. enterica serovar Weltevreden]